MYQLIAAKVKTSLTTGTWSEIDVSSMTVSEMLRGFKIVHLALEHSAEPGVPLFARLSELATLPFMNKQLTLPDWFSSIGARALPVTRSFPSYKSRYVLYRDAHLSLFNVKRAKLGIDPEINYPDGDKTDLLLEKKDIDPVDFANNCLVSVNGFIHAVEGNNRGIYVVDGAKMTPYNRDRNIGIYSFSELGGFKIKHLRDSDFVEPSDLSTDAFYSHDRVPLPSYSESNKLMINLGEDVTDKTVLLSIGGYLHALDSVYRPSGTNSIIVDFDRIPLARRLLESKDYIDLSSLNLTRPIDSSTALYVPEILSMETKKKYMMLSQSFVIIVNNRCVFSNKYIMEDGRMHGFYFHPLKTDMPMLIDNGRLAEYVNVNEQGRSQYRIYGSNENVRYRYEETLWRHQLFIDNTRKVNQGRRYKDAFLLEIGCFEE